MKNTITYTLLIVATLLIGMVIGFLLNGRFTRHRIERMKTSFHEQGFEQGIERMLQPTPEQMQEMQPELHEFAAKQGELMEKYMAERDELFKELESEIEPILTPEQMDRLKRMRHDKRDRFQDERRPPPHGKRLLR